MRQSQAKQIGIVILLTLLMIFTLFPLYYLFLISVKPAGIMFAVPPKFFFSPRFNEYANMIINQKYYRYYFNSIVISFFATVLCLGFGAFGAFAFSAFRFMGQKVLFSIILITRMYPPVTTLIPVFFAVQYLGLHDTRTAVVLAYAGFQIPFVIWIMRAFFEDIPRDIIESASLDGASLLTVFRRIIIPLALPGLLASGILVFVLNWNEFLFALVLTSYDAKTAPVAVASFAETEGMLQWGTLSVLGILTIFPILIIMLFLRKYLIKGLLIGAVKG